MKSGSFILKAGAALVTILVAAAPALNAHAASNVVVVDDNLDWDSCGGLVARYAHIQDAVDSIPAGGSATIKVCPGTYVEDVWIENKGKVQLIGIGMPLIAPVSSDPGVRVTSGKTTTVTGFRINGPNNPGIWFEGADGVISGNTYIGVPRLFNAFEVFMGSRPVRVTIANNTVDGGTFGVYASNSRGKIIVSGNTFKNVSVGVWAEGFASASISGNSIATLASGLGVQTRDASKVTIDSNTIQAQAGIYVETVCGAGNPVRINGPRVSKNTITLLPGAGTGIRLTAAAGQYSLCDPTISGAKITGNKLTGNASSTGIQLVTTVASGMTTMLPHIVKPSFSSNTLSQVGIGFDVPINPFVVSPKYAKNRCDGAACP